MKPTIINMTKRLLLVAAVAADLVASERIQADNLFSAAAKASLLVNRPVAASPHALEDFAWLLRPSLEPGDSRVRSIAVLNTIRKNAAFAASPRVLEEHPELLRSGELRMVTGTNAKDPFGAPADVLRNEALARSPRAIELYPWLATFNWRNAKAGEKSHEIAGKR